MFRIKIILLSILISGSVLIISGLYFLEVVNEVNLHRIDREILTLGEVQLRTWRPSRYWDELDKSLRFIYGAERWKDIIVQVKKAGNEVLYRSPHWPKDISEAIFPDFDYKLETLPPVPGRPMGTWLSSSFVIDRLLNDAAAAGRAGQGDPSSKARGLPSFSNPAGPLLNAPIPGMVNPIPRPLPPSIRSKQPFFKTLKTDQGVWRIGIMGNQFVTILLGVELAGFYRDAVRFKRAFLITVPLSLLVLAVGGWIITNRALKPIALITRTAESITAQGLDRRIPLFKGTDTELVRLVDVINRMLDRIEKSFKQAVRFSADAAHELKTPLAILQGMLDNAVQRATTGSEEQRGYGAMLEEIQRLKAIVQKLLILAHADAGQLALHLESLDLSALIASAIEDVGAIAPDLHLEQRIAPHVMVKADPDLFKQAILNLTSNAVKYNLEGGLIRFDLDTRGDMAVFTISNSGNAIPKEDREMIFHRFYRVDKAHSRAVPGSGLGLSLVREIIHAHRGTIRLNDPVDNLISFTLSLPRILS